MISRITPARPEDLPAVATLVETAYSPWIARIGCRPGPMDDDYAASLARGELELLRDGGALLGLLVPVPQRDALLLDNVAVAPAAQGRGIGRLLMARAEAEAQRLGLPRVRL